jgi:hypothetical protein
MLPVRRPLFLVLLLLTAACGGTALTTTTTSLPAPQAAGSPTSTTTSLPADSSPGATPTTLSQEHLRVDRRSPFVVLDDPAMIPAAQADWLNPNDVVLGVVGEEAHAFPVRQMAYHHIANATVAGKPYLVTY